MQLFRFTLLARFCLCLGSRFRSGGFFGPVYLCLRVTEILFRPLVAEFVRHIAAIDAIHSLLIVILHLPAQIVPRLAVDVVETVAHGLAGLEYQPGKGRVFQTFGLNHFQHAQLHVPAGQPLGVVHRAGHGCGHDLLIGHISDALPFSLFSGCKFLLFLILLGFRRFVRLPDRCWILHASSFLQLFADLRFLGSLR